MPRTERSSIRQPSGVQETSPGRPEASRPALIGCSPSTSLAGSIAAMTASESRCGRQRKLDEDAVDRVVRVQLGDELHQLVLGRLLGQDMLEADHADLARGLALAAHVDAARRVVADEDDREARRVARRLGQGGDGGGDPLAEAGGIGLAVDDAGTHAGILLRDGRDCRHGRLLPGVRFRAAARAPGAARRGRRRGRSRRPGRSAPPRPC